VCRCILTFANDGGTTTQQATELNTANYNTRVVREWQVQNTGTVGAVNVKFDGFADYDLLSDIDGDFSTTGDQTVLGTLDANGELTGVTFTDGAYLNLAFLAPFPGGVSTNLALWLKADNIMGASDGAEFTNWFDSSGNNNTANQTDGDNRPVYFSADNAQAINFNPTVNFNEGSQFNYDHFEFTSNLGIVGNGIGSSLYAVTQADNPGFIMAQEISTCNSQYATHNGVSDIAFDACAIGGYGEAFDNSTPGLISFVDPSATEIFELYGNGALLGTPSTITGWSSWAGSNMTLGSRRQDLSNGDAFDGRMSEIVLYNTELSATDKQKVDSYLALKYGITLDQTVATNYLNSSGAIIWDATVNVSYNTDIFGIGEDSGSALNQKVSRSANNANGPILATTQHFTQANNDALRTVSLGNGNFMILGHNNGADNSFTSSFNGGTNNRSDRFWKVAETGTVGDVYFAIPISGYTFPTGGPSIVVSNDTTFDASDTVIPLLDDGTFYWAIINPIDLQYIALASDTTLSLDENGFVNFKLYPNPAGNTVNLKFSSAISGFLDVKIYNILGSLILAERADIQNNSITINTSLLNTGVYFLNIKDKDKEITKKLIIE